MKVMKRKAGGRKRSNHMPPKAVETHESHLEELFVAATSSKCLAHTAAFNSLSVRHTTRATSKLYGMLKDENTQQYPLQYDKPIQARFSFDKVATAKCFEIFFIRDCPAAMHRLHIHISVSNNSNEGHIMNVLSSSIRQAKPRTYSYERNRKYKQNSRG